MNDRPAAVFIADEQLDQIAIRVAKRTLSELRDLIDRGGGLRISDHDKQEIADLVAAKLPEISPAPLSEEDKDDIAERVVTLLGAEEPITGEAQPLNPASSATTADGGTLDFIDPNAKPLDPEAHEQTK